MITSRVTTELFFLLRDRENDLFLSYLIKKRYLSRLRYMQISYGCAPAYCVPLIFSSLSTIRESGALCDTRARDS